MTGKHADFAYTDDLGNSYRLRLDQSNSKAVAAGYGYPMYYAAPPSLLWLPPTIEPRVLYTYNRDAPRRKRRFTVGYKFIWDWLLTRDNPAIVTLGGVNPEGAVDKNTAWIITSWASESRSRLHTR
jgi:hypothetical protein